MKEGAAKRESELAERARGRKRKRRARLLPARSIPEPTAVQPKPYPRLRVERAVKQSFVVESAAKAQLVKRWRSSSAP